MIRAPFPAVKKNIPAMLTDTDMLFRQAREGVGIFGQAKPFPHVLLPGMIKASCRVALCEGLRQWQVDPPPAGFYPQAGLPPVVNLLLWELSSSTLMRHFASLTGAPPLLPDPFWIGGGAKVWSSESMVQTSDEQFFLRHPETDLQHPIRLEIFVADDSQLNFPMELEADGQAATFYSVSSGTALISRSDNYRLILRSSAPHRWCSLTSYFYVNDRARILNGEEQFRAY